MLAEDEYRELRVIIQQVESQLAGSLLRASPELLDFLHHARKRLDTLKEEVEREQHEEAGRESSIMAAAEAAREKALSEAERRIYAGFLEEDYFTKKDFGALDQFYSKSWDHLSTHGKTEMTRRVLTGIENREFQFNELPGLVKKDSADFIQQAMSGDAAISETDRQALLNASQRSGYQIAQHPASTPVMGSTEVPPVDSVTGRDAEKNQVEAVNAKGSPSSTSQSPLPASLGNISLDTLSLPKLPVVTTSSAEIQAGLPRPSAVKER